MTISELLGRSGKEIAMSATREKIEPSQLLPAEVARRTKEIWALWDAPRLRRWSRWLILTAAAALFLERAGTIEVGYTLTISYVLIVLASVINAPAVLRGWRILPPWLSYTAAALLTVYIVALLFGHQTEVAGLSRASGSRGPIYLSDLALGLCVVGLVAGSWENRTIRPLVIALAVGGFLAGAYASYQWLALRLGLPLGNINNAANSDGTTFGASQGPGLFGGERVNGTFLEPHFLAAYLATMIPLGLVTTRWLVGWWRRFAWGGVVMMLVALLLTISAPGWGELALAISAASLLYVASRGWVLPSAAVATITMAIWLSVIPALASPQLVSPIVGRSGGELALTTAFRTETWRAALRLWAHNPVLGAGPGQSSVLLATAHAVPGGLANGALISSQGIWAAALLDGGVIAVGLWLILLGGGIIIGGLALWRYPTDLRWATVAASGAAVIDVMITGDRLFPSQWLVLALMLAAAASYAPTRDSGDSH
jgi:hypothetical protein